MNTDNVDTYWNQFLASLPADSPYRGRDFIAEGWGDGPELADELGALIAQGTKTATCSSAWDWQAEGETPPGLGTLTVVLDGKGAPLCIVETVETTVRNLRQ